MAVLFFISSTTSINAGAGKGKGPKKYYYTWCLSWKIYDEVQADEETLQGWSDDAQERLRTDDSGSEYGPACAVDVYFQVGDVIKNWTCTGGSLQIDGYEQRNTMHSQCDSINLVVYSMWWNDTWWNGWHFNNDDVIFIATCMEEIGGTVAHEVGHIAGLYIGEAEELDGEEYIHRIMYRHNDGTCRTVNEDEKYAYEHGPHSGGGPAKK